MEKKVASFVTNGFLPENIYHSFIAKLRDLGCDEIAVICLSQNYYKGLPVSTSIDKRIDMLKAAGTDNVILLPKETDYLDNASQIIAISSFFMHDSTISELYIPFTGNLDLIKPISDALMRTNEPLSYMEKYVEGASAFLNLSNNSWNMKLYHNIRIYYNPVKPVPVLFDFPIEPACDITPSDDECLYLKIKKQIESIPSDLVSYRLNDIMCSTQERTELLLKKLSSDSCSSFLELAAAFESTGFSDVEARCYLLMVLNNYRLIDNSVASLHGYSRTR